MIKEAIVKIVSKEDLTYEEAYTVMNEIMSGETSPTQNAAFLAALSTKSAKAETTDEIAGCAAAMRDHATKVDTGMDVMEIVGTGGDNAQSFNISTTSALVAAAGGVKIAKHGNRAASSNSGTADCLEALGVNIDQSPSRCVEMLREAGMCFFFAQKYHTSMKYVGAIRRELGFRTVFNILGPLTTSARCSIFWDRSQTLLLRRVSCSASMTSTLLSRWHRCSSTSASSAAWWFTDRISSTKSP